MKYNKSRPLFIYLLCLLFCQACNQDTSGLEPRALDGRVILVYIGGDNNLSGEAWFKAEAMTRAMSFCPAGRLLIYLDPADGEPCLLEASSDGKGKMRSETVVEFEETNSADPDVFRNVISRVTEDYPASSYGLYVFSHGSGWLPPGSLASPSKEPARGRSIITDNRNEMELPEFASAIPNGLFDFIVFEACFMAGVEVAYELRNKSPLIVASSAEIVSPGFSLVYDVAFPYLFKPAADLEGFVDAIADYIDNTAFYKASTLSVIDTRRIETLARWVEDNVNFQQDIDILKIQKFDTYSYRLFFDLEHYCSILLGNDELKISELEQLIADCVPYRRATEEFLLNVSGIRGFQIIRHSGLTTYIEQESFPYLNRKYSETGWYQATR